MRISTAVNAVGITGYGESVTYQQSRVRAGGGGGLILSQKLNCFTILAKC